MNADTITLTPDVSTAAEQRLLRILGRRLLGIAPRAGWVPVGTVLPGQWGVRDSYATITCGTSRARMTLPNRTTAFRLRFQGIKQPSAIVVPTELAMGGSYEVKASLVPLTSGAEDGRINFTFGGRKLGYVRNGTPTYESDPLHCDLPAGKDIRLYIWANRLSSAAFTIGGEKGQLSADEPYWPRHSVNPSGAGASWNAEWGTDFANSTGIDPSTKDWTESGSGTYTQGISANFQLLGQTAAPAVDALGWVGDSITAASGDIFTVAESYSGLGFPGRFCGVTRPWIWSAIGGDRIQYRVDSNAYNVAGRIELETLCDRLFVWLGTNDCIGSRTFAQMQADTLQAIDRWRQRGVRTIIGATILPRATSTDGYATLGNQTDGFAGFQTVRQQYNAWLKAGGVYDAVIDLAAVVESTVTAGLYTPASVVLADTVAAGSTTTVLNTNATLTANAHVGRSVAISAQTKQITANTTNTITLVSALSGAPATSTPYTITESPTADGTHPSPYGHRLITAALAASGAF